MPEHSSRNKVAIEPIEYTVSERKKYWINDINWAFAGVMPAFQNTS
jgi:hypothetical protein